GPTEQLLRARGRAVEGTGAFAASSSAIDRPGRATFAPRALGRAVRRLQRIGAADRPAYRRDASRFGGRSKRPRFRPRAVLAPAPALALPVDAEPYRPAVHASAARAPRLAGSVARPGRPAAVAPGRSAAALQSRARPFHQRLSHSLSWQLSFGTTALHRQQFRGDRLR